MFDDDPRARIRVTHLETNWDIAIVDHPEEQPLWIVSLVLRFLCRDVVEDEVSEGLRLIDQKAVFYVLRQKAGREEEQQHRKSNQVGICLTQVTPRCSMRA